MSPRSASPSTSVTGVLLLLASLLWVAAVAWSAARGALQPLAGLPYALLVVAGIVAPTLLYVVAPAVRRLVGRLGLYWLTLAHVWRVPAGLLFVAFGVQGELPPAFWIPAGIGDLLVGLYAARLLFRGGDRAFYWRFHVVGFADFVIAVGSGLVHTLLADPRMAPLAALPLALIPLFGVGLSGASHLVAFHLLRRAPGAEARA